MTTVTTQAPAGSGAMPRQIAYIIGNEGCERFSFYGMRNILTAFLTTSLLLYLPEDMRAGEAKHIFHNFMIGVYFFPLLGGWLADRLWRQVQHHHHFQRAVLRRPRLPGAVREQPERLLRRPGSDRHRIGRHQALRVIVLRRPVR